MNRLRILLAAAIVATGLLTIGLLAGATASAQEPVCVDQAQGQHMFTVTVGGAAQEVKVDVGEHGVVTEIYYPGDTPLGVQEGLALLAQFNVTLPAAWTPVPCPPEAAAAMSLPTTGTGGLAATNSGVDGMIVGLALATSLGGAALALTMLLARRRSRLS